jgi:hypothetical protein
MIVIIKRVTRSPTIKPLYTNFVIMTQMSNFVWLGLLVDYS